MRALGVSCSMLEVLPYDRRVQKREILILAP
jgi:hypothetical protein